MSASPVSEDDKVVLNNPKPVPRPGTWISAAIVTILGAMLIHGLVTNEKFHWSTVWFFPVSYTHLTLPTIYSV